LKNSFLLSLRAKRSNLSVWWKIATAIEMASQWHFIWVFQRSLSRSYFESKNY